MRDKSVSQRICAFSLLFFFSAFFSALFSTNSIASSFYRCESSDGKTSFSDKPCPTKSKTTDKGKLNSFRISGTASNKEFTDDKSAPNQQAVFIFRAKFSNILQSLTPLRMSITRYYMERGQWPNNLKDLGFKAKAMQSAHIASTRIKKNGRIVASLKPALGENKIIILSPKPAMNNTTIDWQCSSNFTSVLLGDAELCDSRKIF